MFIGIKRENHHALVPEKGTEDSAGYDLFVPNWENYSVEPQTVAKIDLGFSIKIPKGYFGGIYPRSGVATKRGLRLSNCVGVIDADYRGHVIVAIYNDSDKVQHIMGGEKIAQLIIQPCLNYFEFTECDELDETDRGSGGFGSTGA